MLVFGTSQSAGKLRKGLARLVNQLKLFRENVSFYGNQALQDFKNAVLADQKFK